MDILDAGIPALDSEVGRECGLQARSNYTTKSIESLEHHAGLVRSKSSSMEKSSNKLRPVRRGKNEMVTVNRE